MASLYSHRSYARCVSEGYGFLAHNLWKVVKIMTPFFILSSVFTVLSHAINTHANIAIMAGKEIFMEEIIVAVILFILMIATYGLALWRLFNFLKKELVNINKEGNADGNKNDAPSPYNINKVLKVLFHNSGKIIGTALLGLFIFIVLSALVYLPIVTATYSYFDSIEGQINFGDTALISTGGYVLIFIAGTICFTIINIISIGFFATLAFLYGDTIFKLQAK